VLRRLAEGRDRPTITATVGITPGQVWAVTVHVKMGTYGELPGGKPARVGVSDRRRFAARLMATTKYVPAFDGSANRP
jgi:hypothetical protein